MAQKPQDWDRIDIYAAIRRTGTDLGALSVANGLCRQACCFALTHPWPGVQAIIAARIGQRPQDIWPSRYDAAGAPLPRSQIIARRVASSSQKRKAA